MTRVNDVSPEKGSYGDMYRQQLEKEDKMAEQVGKDAGKDKDDEQINSDARHEQIRATFHDLFELDQEIAAAIAENVTPIKDRRKKFMRTLKKDLDMPIADINLEYKLYVRARDAAKEMDEGGEKVLENLRELHEALHPGQSVDWVKAVDETIAQKSMGI